MKEKENKNPDEKIRFTLWMKNSTANLVNQYFKEDNCGTKSEFIEKAIAFYAGYVASEKNQNYLPNIVVSTLKSIVRDSDTRQNRYLYKLSVEISMMSRVLSILRGVDDIAYDALRRSCENEVRKLNGVITMEDAIELQHQ